MLRWGLPNWNTALERAGSWFLHSGIQEPDGGVARYYRSDTGRNAPVSTEITGYAASFLVYLHERAGEQAYQEAAVRAARYLAGVWDAAASLFPFEAPRGGADRLAYFFDSGIIVRGLLAVWRATGDQEFLDLAAAAGHGMMANFLSTVFTHPIVSLTDRRAIAYQPRWSTSPGCYQLKSAMAWSDLFDVTGHADFWNAYEVSVARALADDAQFLPGPGDESQTMDRLHAYSYFLEGMLPCASRRIVYRAGGRHRQGGRTSAPTSSRCSSARMCMRNCCECGCSPNNSASYRSTRKPPRMRPSRPRFPIRIRRRAPPGRIRLRPARRRSNALRQPGLNGFLRAGVPMWQRSFGSKPSRRDRTCWFDDAG